MAIVWEGHADIIRSKAQTLVVPVNTQGVMGKGLALQFKRRYPKMFVVYRELCENRWFDRHAFFVYTVDESRKLLLFPTKRKWREPSKLDWIEHGLKAITEQSATWGITRLAVPALGCGEGKLEWEEVYDLIWAWLDPIELEVGIFLPLNRDD